MIRLQHRCSFGLSLIYQIKKANIMRIWKSFHQLPLLTLQAHIPQGFYSESEVRLLAPSFSLQIKIGKELAINSRIVTLF